jgi:hypothetical protein
MTTLKGYYIIFCFFFLFGGKGNAQNLMLSIPKNNSIYRGIDYEIELGFLAENNQDFEVSLSKKGTIKKINSNRYIINSCEVGLLNVQVKYKDSVFVKPIIIKNFEMVFSILGREGGTIPFEELLKAEELNCYPNVSNLKIKCEITSYKFSVRRDNGHGFDAVLLENEGGNFSKSVKSYMKTLKLGDSIIFNSIRAKCPCDEHDYPIGSMSFLIK